MKPLKKIKKLEKFQKNKDTFVLPQENRITFRYYIEIPLNGVLYKFWVNPELPSITINKRTNQVLNDFINGDFSLSSRCNPINIIFRDIVDGDINEFKDQLFNWLHYNNKMNVTISRFNAIGELDTRWHLIGTTPTNIYYPEYDSDLDFEITLQYDYFSINY
jgi:hypothetical protein